MWGSRQRCFPIWRLSRDACEYRCATCEIDLLKTMFGKGLHHTDAGTERTSTTRNGRAIMKVKCAVSGNTKATFLPKTSGGLNPLLFLGRPSTMKHVHDKIHNPLKCHRARRWKILCSDIHHVQRQRETESLECAGYLESCKKQRMDDRCWKRNALAAG